MGQKETTPNTKDRVCLGRNETGLREAIKNGDIAAIKKLFNESCALHNDRSVGIVAWKGAQDSTSLTPNDYACLRGYYCYI
ncbi:hypothetical protein JHK87_039736 [Glycine soja]|nr:hypothetical protein JHK87_039736 [Glycine soja]